MLLTQVTDGLVKRTRELCEGEPTELQLKVAAERAVAELDKLPQTPGDARKFLVELLPREHPQFGELFARATCGPDNIREALVTAVALAASSTQTRSSTAAA
jgi:hypothetical protein